MPQAQRARVGPRDCACEQRAWSVESQNPEAGGLDLDKSDDAAWVADSSFLFFEAFRKCR